MTTTQAKQVVADLIDAGYVPMMQLISNGNWQISASTQAVVTQAQAQTFATNHGVTLSTYQVASSVTFT